MQRHSGIEIGTLRGSTRWLAAHAGAGLGLLEALCALALLGLLASALELQYGCLRLLGRTERSFQAAVEAERAGRFNESDCHESPIEDTRAAVLHCSARGRERFALVRSGPVR